MYYSHYSKLNRVETQSCKAISLTFSQALQFALRVDVNQTVSVLYYNNTVNITLTNRVLCNFCITSRVRDPSRITQRKNNAVHIIHM